MSRHTLTLVSITLAAHALVACGQHADEAASTENAPPIVGALELAISRNHAGTQPTGAARIEISPSELRVDGQQVIALERGRAAASEVAGDVITQLRTRLGAGSRSSAALWVNANVPYLTLAQVMKTIEAAGIHEVSFAVRVGTAGPQTGFMRLARWRVVPAGEEAVTFQSPARPWSEFAEHWQEVYDACRGGQYIDCDPRALNPAEGGNLQLTLWARGQGMKLTFQRIAPEGEEAAAPPTNDGPALIEGVRAPPPRAEEDHGPPATEGAFNMRHQESVVDDSAISNSSHPVCGNASCQTIVEADATTPSMRVLSMIGAVFPDGFAEPDIAFRMPEL